MATEAPIPRTARLSPPRFILRTLGAGLALVIASVAMAGAPPQPTVQSAIKPIELAVEASGGTVILPSGSVGTLVVTPCVACVPRSFVAGSAARYFIGRIQVSIEDVRRELAARPQARVGVFFDANTHELTRVLVSGTVAPAVRKR